MMRSLHARLLTSAAAALALFLLFLTFILDRAVVEIAKEGVEARLRAQIYTLLGATDLDDDGEFSISEPLPEPRFGVPDSELFARIFGSGGEVVWASESSLGRPVSPPPMMRPGAFVFDFLPDESGDQGYFCMSFNVLWERESGAVLRDLTLQVAETDQQFARQVATFRATVVKSFVLAGLIYLAVNTLLLRMALRPLRQLADEVHGVECGEREGVTRHYPLELDALARNLNVLIRQGQGHVQRYRNALGDLAHSLKTPLAVLRNDLDGVLEGERRASVVEQLNRIDMAIQYQLKRAAAAQQSSFGASVPVAPMAQKLVHSLEKVYADRGLVIALHVAEGLRFQGDSQDFYEILGNLADNACKWARHRVEITLGYAGDLTDKGSMTLSFEVSDDGPGLEPAQFDALLARGARGDQAVDGHGIGLAVVSELVEKAYGGQLQLDSSASGTRLRVVLAPPGAKPAKG